VGIYQVFDNTVPGENSNAAGFSQVRST